MALITLIGEHLAVTGGTFQFLGPNNECKNCKLKTVCFNLKPWRDYEIVSVRDNRHGCTIHEGFVVPVEVKELPILTAVDSTLLEGSITTIDKKNCKHIGCPGFDLCTTPAVQKDKTYCIQKIYEPLDCPKGFLLQKAEITEESY